MYLLQEVSFSGIISFQELSFSGIILFRMNPFQELSLSGIFQFRLNPFSGIFLSRNYPLQEMSFRRPFSIQIIFGHFSLFCHKLEITHFLTFYSFKTLTLLKMLKKGSYFTIFLNLYFYIHFGH